MTYTAYHHQGVIELFWLHSCIKFMGTLMLPSVNGLALLMLTKLTITPSV